MDIDSPCKCPRCGWLGTLHDAHKPSQQHICPHCNPETQVQRLGQKGLDGLRTEHSLLPKMGYAPQLISKAERINRMEQIERFFEHIDQPLR